MNGNYIKISRKMLEWEWWDDINTSRLFFYMLLKANWKDGKFKGEDVARGSFISSISKLSECTNLSIDEVRTALKHLKSTGEITSKSHSKYTVFTIKNYGLYQDVPDQNPEQFPRSSQAVPEQLPSSSHSIPELFPTIEEGKNDRMEEGEEKKEGKKGKVNGEPMMEMFERLSANVQLSNPLSAKIQEWLKYKSERREPYKEQGLKSLLTLIVKHAQQVGEGTVIELIDECMASGWRGIIWDRLKLKSNRNNSQSDNKSIYHDQVTKLINEQQMGYEDDEDLPEVMF